MTSPAAEGEKPVDVTIVVPLLNEEANVAPLYQEISTLIGEAREKRERYEVIFVDDGSRDGTARKLADLAGGAEDVTIVELARRFGQTAALAAGFARARGKVVVAMDGDLQNDPRDIPSLVGKLDEPPGWDVVSGWRRDRQDPYLSRRLPSSLANWLIRKLTRMRAIHDFGCTLKAYRREILQRVEIYGEMHRYLPVICKWQGARVTEIVVNHRPRIHGSSKYGIRRTAKVLLDLITVKFLGDYLTKPLYFFGKIAILALLSSILSLGTAIVQKLGYLTSTGSSLPLNRNVLVLFSMMLFLVSFMLVMMGVLSELMIRIYHQAGRHTHYIVRRAARAGRTLETGDPGSRGGAA